MRSSITGSRFDAVTMPLLASAFILAALVVFQIGRLHGDSIGRVALAEMVADGSEYSMMTTSGGNEELLYVLDSRNGRLLVYEPMANAGIRLLDGVNVAEWVTRLREKFTEKQP